MDIRQIEQSDDAYPVTVKRRLGTDAPRLLYSIGDLAILRNHLLGLLCSIRCPGSIVIQTLDAVRALRDAGVSVIGGFHSPMERECLDILLRGSQPVVLCPARGIANLRIGQSARKAVEEGRLLVLSRFDQETVRTTAAQAVKRNAMVAALADSLLVPHANPRGKTWSMIKSVLARRQVVLTFEVDLNVGLIESGAEGVSSGTITNASKPE